MIFHHPFRVMNHATITKPVNYGELKNLSKSVKVTPAKQNRSLFFTFFYTKFL